MYVLVSLCIVVFSIIIKVHLREQQGFCDKSIFSALNNQVGIFNVESDEKVRVRLLFRVRVKPLKHHLSFRKYANCMVIVR